MKPDIDYIHKPEDNENFKLAHEYMEKYVETLVDEYKFKKENSYLISHLEHISSELKEIKGEMSSLKQQNLAITDTFRYLDFTRLTVSRSSQAKENFIPEETQFEEIFRQHLPTPDVTHKDFPPQQYPKTPPQPRVISSSKPNKATVTILDDETDFRHFEIISQEQQLGSQAHEDPKARFEQSYKAFTSPHEAPADFTHARDNPVVPYYTEQHTSTSPPDPLRGDSAKPAQDSEREFLELQMAQLRAALDAFKQKDLQKAEENTAPKAQEKASEAPTQSAKKAKFISLSKPTKKAKSPIVKIITNVAFYVCMALLIIGAISFANDDDINKSLFGFRYYYIKSASMEPEMPVGSMVLTKVVKPEDIKVGDDITIYTGDEKGDSYLTHRVVELTTDAENELAFRTKGINNRANDPKPYSSKLVVGKVILCIPLLGKIMTFVQTQIYLVIGMFVLLIALSFMLKILFAKPKPKTDDATATESVT